MLTLLLAIVAACGLAYFTAPYIPAAASGAVQLASLGRRKEHSSIKYVLALVSSVTALMSLALISSVEELAQLAYKEQAIQKRFKSHDIKIRHKRLRLTNTLKELKISHQGKLNLRLWREMFSIIDAEVAMHRIVKNTHRVHTNYRAIADSFNFLAKKHGLHTGRVHNKSISLYGHGYRTQLSIGGSDSRGLEQELTIAADPGLLRNIYIRIASAKAYDY